MVYADERFYTICEGESELNQIDVANMPMTIDGNVVRLLENVTQIIIYALKNARCRACIVNLFLLISLNFCDTNGYDI